METPASCVALVLMSKWIYLCFYEIYTKGRFTLVLSFSVNYSHLNVFLVRTLIELDTAMVLEQSS